MEGEPAAQPSFLGAYPWRTAWCADIDITGHRRPQSYYREIVFGLRTEPYIAVVRPEHHGAIGATTPWSWSDSVSAWSWPGREGAPVTVEVYAAADEVELLVNGRSLGRRPAGAAHRFRATFETTYEPGLLEAVAWLGTAEAGRSGLSSAYGPVELAVEVDRSEIAGTTQDLAFVTISLVDPSGVLHVGTDRIVAVAIDGPGVLQGLGSANPATEEGFGEPRCTTFDGRALAVVRPTGSGVIAITVTTDGCEPVQRPRGRVLTRCPHDLGAPVASVSGRMGPLHLAPGRAPVDRRVRVGPQEAPIPEQNALAPGGRPDCHGQSRLPRASTCSRTTCPCSLRKPRRQAAAMTIVPDGAGDRNGRGRVLPPRSPPVDRRSHR